jgi:hypothetical protein
MRLADIVDVRLKRRMTILLKCRMLLAMPVENELPIAALRDFVNSISWEHGFSPNTNI